MDIFQRQKNTLLQMFGEAIILGQAQKNTKLVRFLQQEAEHLQKSELLVVVAGEFKQGKSSLVNALLEEPGLFPEATDIATCLVSTISFGEQEQVKVLVQEGERIVPRVIRREEIRDYVMESRNPKNARQAHMLTIESPNLRLREGLALVDTPGTGGLFKNHSEITYRFLPMADAVLFVSDALSPLSVKDLGFVERIAAFCKRIVFVLTKIDLLSASDYEQVMQGNREKLSRVLDCAVDEVRIVPVSSSLKLNYLESRDPEDLTESNFEALERELWNILAQRGDILLNRALYVLEQAVTEMMTPLEVERETLLRSPQIEEMKQKLAAARERLRQLENNKSEWRIQLQQGMRSIRMQVSHQFQLDSIELRKKLSAYLDSAELLQTPNTIVSMIEEEIYQVMTGLDRILNEQAAQLHARIQQLTNLELSKVSVSIRDYAGPDTKVSLQLETLQPEKKLSRWDKLMIGLSRGRVEAGGASALGAVVGGGIGLVVDILTLGATGLGGVVIGSMLGSKIGSVAGYKSGIARGLDQMKEQNLAEARRKLEKELLPFIEQSKLLCNNSITQAIDGLESSMVNEFRGLIDRERAASEEALRTIGEAQKLSQEAAQKRLQELLPIIERVKRLYFAIQQVAQHVALTTEPAIDERETVNV